MAALKIGLTMKLWWGLRVVPYASRKEALSSSEGFSMFFWRAMEVNSRPLGREDG